MIVKILKSQHSAREKLKRTILYLSRRRGADRSWSNRHAIVFRQNPELYGEAGRLQEHLAYWSRFGNKPKDDTFRICQSISGASDPKTIPEEVFQTDIEPSLTIDDSAHLQGHKSLYGRHFGVANFPVCYIHKINREFLNGELNPIQKSEVERISENLTYPVVMKPVSGSNGGDGIHFVSSPGLLTDLLISRDNVVVQEKISQHPWSSQFHPRSLNTFRVYLYKPFSERSFRILGTAFRMGNGREVDNVTGGGLVSFVNGDNMLHGYALDRYGKKYDRHPITGTAFCDSVPDPDGMRDLACHIANRLINIRVVGLDLCYTSEGKWKVIEVNTQAHSIRFLQYAGQPFFGDYTDEVVKYCLENHWALR